MGTPIALVGIIIMAINTGTVTGSGSGSVKGKGAGTGLGKEYTSNPLSSIGINSDSDTTISLSQTLIKIGTNTRKDKDEDKNEDKNSYQMSDFRIIQDTDSNISISIRKENEQYVDQSIAETGRSRRHLGGMYQFSKSTFRTGKEFLEVV